MTYPNFDLIRPERSVVFLPFDGQFRMDVGENLLTDGDMEAPTPVAYTAYNSIVSKESGGYSGQCLRVAHTSLAYFWAYQQVLTANYWYHVTGYSQGDGTRKPAITLRGALPISWQRSDGLAVWEALDFVAQSNTNRIYIGCDGFSAGFVQFDTVDLREHPQVCRSLSKLPGVLNYARLGDGHTAATMPTQRAGGRGLEFTGTTQQVNLDWVAGGPLDTHTFTFLIYCQAKPSDMPASSYMSLYEVGTNSLRYILYWYGATSSLEFIILDGVTDLTLTSTKAYLDGQDHVYAVTLDATGCKLYCDGEIVASVVGDVRIPTFDPASTALIGKFGAFTTATFKGTMYSSAIYPFALTQSQVREVGRRMRQARNI